MSEESAVVIDSLSASVDQCVHCSLPVPKSRLLRGDKFCCAGCSFAYGIIHDLGLSGFYSLRDKLPPEIAKPAATRGLKYQYLEDPALQEAFVSTTSSGLSRVVLQLEGIHCPACVWLIEKLAEVGPGISSIRVNIASSRADVLFDSELTSLQKVAQLLDAVGYPPAPLKIDDSSGEASTDRRGLLRLGVAGFSAGNVMLLSVALYQGAFSGIQNEHENLFRWFCFIVSSPAVFYSAYPFYSRAFSSLRVGLFHIDVPLSLGILFGYFVSAFNTIRGAGEIYFDSLNILIFLLLVGRWLQTNGIRKVAAKNDVLYSLLPLQAIRVTDGQKEEVFTGSLKKKDTVFVPSGAVVPADGIILHGVTHIDNSILTGESLPESVSIGDLVYGGARNVGDDILFEVSASAEFTRVGELLRQPSSGSYIEKNYSIADRISRPFVFTVVLIAILTALYWILAGNVEHAIERTLALLVITCPCAAGLSAPLALSVSRFVAAKNGVLFREAQAVEQASRVRHVVFDKTGTLTEGVSTISRAYYYRGAHFSDESGIWSEELHRESLAEILPIVYALEMTISHPVAKALREYATNNLEHLTEHLPELKEFKRERLGVQAIDHKGRKVSLGAWNWVVSVEKNVSTIATEGVVSELIEESLSPLALLIEDNVVAIFGCGDRLRVEARAAIVELAKLGRTFSILSGDRTEIVHSIARELSVSPQLLLGEQSPEQKRDFIIELRNRECCAMVGDGVNDSSALTEAQLGIAVSGGAEVCLSVSSALLLRPDLGLIPKLIAYSDRAISVVKRNLGFSLVYNMVGGTLAVSGYVTPLIAAVLMPISSLFVIFSSLSLSRTKEGEWI